jgi:hypothetical protein
MKNIIYIILLLIIASSCNVQKHYAKSIPKVKNTFQSEAIVNLSKQRKYPYSVSTQSISPVPLKQIEPISCPGSGFQLKKINRIAIFNHKEAKSGNSLPQQTHTIRQKGFSRTHSDVNIAKVILVTSGILLLLLGWPILILGSAFSAGGAILLGVLMLLVGLILLIVGLAKPDHPVKIPSQDNKSKQNQPIEDVVYLKDGSVIKGTIIATIPHEFIKIQTKDGSVIVERMDKVEKITKEPVN